MKRRSFLQFLAADAALPFAARLASAASPYQVGIGNSTDPYQATQSAVASCGQWPAAAIFGKTVMIKPNLVTGHVASTGVTTDPQVVRALVDLALQAGAAQVIIAEGGIETPANFAPCGYSFFSTYDPRVQLMDFSTQGITLARVPNGLSYTELYLPTPALQPNLFFISAGKMKCHVSVVASLSMKNLFGLPSPLKYYITGAALARQGLHLHGVDETVVDVNLARPVDFAVIDGMWGMEGNGPLSGTPIQRNLVLAGLNTVAVDLTALEVMQISQPVAYLAYAASKGLGPTGMGSVAVLGDSYSPMPFTPAQTVPLLWRPTPYPNPISVSAGPQTTIYYKIPVACNIRAEVILDSDVSPNVQLVRLLQNWTLTQAGTWSIKWDGTTNTGAVVPPGLYLAHIMAENSYGVNHATSWIVVNA